MAFGFLKNLFKKKEADSSFIKNQQNHEGELPPQSEEGIRKTRKKFSSSALYDKRFKIIIRILKQHKEKIETLDNAYISCFTQLDQLKKDYENFIKEQKELNNQLKLPDMYAHKCMVCKSEDELEIHHIDFNHENNERKNLTVLCKNCHARVHSNKLSDPKYYAQKIIQIKLTYLEENICKIILGLKASLGVEEISLLEIANTLYPDRDYKKIRTTISTYISNLEKKGYVKRRRKGTKMYVILTDKMIEEFSEMLGDDTKEKIKKILKKKRLTPQIDAY